ncbi:replication associated protein [Lactobacillus sp. LL6]|uniref:replication associated protein n=1 Tax=Lactobacillus sp. LL6 TaxID=2596827 RepID=UPI001186B652|nr:replication associated protein [Lactobacillus sp. LL6]TSO26638.1 replication associated protein [Lactobacillus sp. LL6]
MSKILPVNKFKKQYKKVKNNPRWNKIFNGTVPFSNDNGSPWEYVMECFLKDEQIDSYFYEHPITLTQKQRQQIKNRLPTNLNSEIKVCGLDLHFDGHNGDHLLLFVRTNQKLIYLIGIGTHSELFNS